MAVPDLAPLILHHTFVTQQPMYWEAVPAPAPLSLLFFFYPELTIHALYALQSKHHATQV